MSGRSSNWNVVALFLAGGLAVVALAWMASYTGEAEEDVEVQTTRQLQDVAESDPEERTEIIQQETREESRLIGSQVVETGSDVGVAIIRNHVDDQPPRQLSKAVILERLGDIEPTEWGEVVSGVDTNFVTARDEIALTLDACDGGYDEELIEFLRDREIPATLFVAGLWINAHPQRLRRLAEDPLFEIANHGRSHRPCSVAGKEAAEIEGTEDVVAAYDEIEQNAGKIEAIIGERPTFYRSGTAHYDEVCTQIARMTGHRVAGFDVVGDLGAMYDATQVREAVETAEPGSIVVLHMNKPDGDTAEGVKKAIPALRERGFVFRKLSDVFPD